MHEQPLPHWFVQLRHKGMKESSKRFVISSESKNAGGFRVRTKGIDMKEFNNNPLLLFMHQRPTGKNRDEVLPLGFWQDLRVEPNGDITGQPVFDDTDDFAMKIYNKVENGTLKMASAGLHPQKFVNIDGEQWLEQSTLKEASIVDIGLNKDALAVALVDEDGGLITLADAMKGRAGEGTGGDVRKRIRSLMDGGMTLEDISRSLAAMGEDASRTAGTLSAILNGEIANPPANLLTFLNRITQKDHTMKTLQFSPSLLPMLKLTEEADEAAANKAVIDLVTLAERQAADIGNLQQKNKELQDKIDLAEKESHKAKCLHLAEKAVEEGRITKDQQPMIVELAEKDFEAAEKLVKTFTPSKSVQSRVAASAASADDTLIKMSWDELDKANKLITLKEKDFETFKDKYKQKFNKDYAE